MSQASRLCPRLLVLVVRTGVSVSLTDLAFEGVFDEACRARPDRHSRETQCQGQQNETSDSALSVDQRIAWRIARIHCSAGFTGAGGSWR